MKKIISFFLIFISVFSMSVCPVYATTQTVQDIITVNNGVVEGYNELLRYAGLLIDTGIAVQRSTLQFVKDRLVALGFFDNTPTDEEVQDFFNDNITVSPHSDSHHGKDVSYTPDMNLYVQNEITSIFNEYGFYYAYAGNMLNYATSFPDAYTYNALSHIYDELKSDYDVILWARSSSLFCVVAIEKYYDYGLVQTSTSNNDYNTVLYNYVSWSKIDIYRDTHVKFYNYDSTNHEFVLGSSPTLDGYARLTDNPNGLYNNTFTLNNVWYMINFDSNSREYKVFKTLNDLKNNSVGTSPYYITDSYNSFTNTSGSYNTTTTDNSVTYGDVANYVNNYYGDNGKYPTQDEIKITIQVIQESGSGSGGGSGGDSGGGSGDSTSIWDFLSRLGEVLGGLIKNLGNMLTSLIDSIISIINDVIGKVPQVFNNLLDIVFGGLPEDLRSVIILGITIMVLYGIIKVIRG